MSMWQKMVLVTIVVLLLFIIVQQQARPPVPAPPGPVLPKLPDLTADLKSAKSLCEGRAKQVKRMARDGRLAPAALDHGGQLYTDAKAELDGCIQLLVTGLTGRFDEEDASKIERRMESANKKLIAFAFWADEQIKPNSVGALGPLGPAPENLLAWVQAVSKQKDEAVKQLRGYLEGCRLTDWSDL